MKAITRKPLKLSRVISGSISAQLCSSALVTHVDKIFGWSQQTRMRCSVCGLVAERTILPKSKILTWLLMSSDRKKYTVMYFYLDSFVCTKDVMSCSKCEVCTNHEVASRVATTPELLLLWLDRGSGNETFSLDVEEDLMLPGLVFLRFVAVIYRARRSHGPACCSCACPGRWMRGGISKKVVLCVLTCCARLRRPYPARSTRTISAPVSVSQRSLPYRSFRRALGVHYLLLSSLCF